MCVRVCVCDLILSHAALKLKVADAAAEVAHLALVGAVALVSKKKKCNSV